MGDNKLKFGLTRRGFERKMIEETELEKELARISKNIRKKDDSGLITACDIDRLLARFRFMRKNDIDWNKEYKW
jgi:hypothetical protein